MPETGNGVFEWKRTVPVAAVDGLNMWLHDCGGIGMFPTGADPELRSLCATCEQSFGFWKRLLVEYTGRLRANTTIEQDEEDLDIGLRIAPGNTHRSRKYRWRNTETGQTFEELPARFDPLGPPAGRWVREVAVTGSSHGHWWPADPKEKNDA